MIERLPPACLVRSLAEARIALAPGAPVTLLSARGAAIFAGTLFWQALVGAARAQAGGTVLADILDCADASGRALEALRLGQRVIVLEPVSVGYTDVVERASVLGAAVLAVRPPALDCGRRDAERRVGAWLGDDRAGGGG